MDTNNKIEPKAEQMDLSSRPIQSLKTFALTFILITELITFHHEQGVNYI